MELSEMMSKIIFLVFMFFDIIWIFSNFQKIQSIIENDNFNVYRRSFVLKFIEKHFTKYKNSSAYSMLFFDSTVEFLILCFAETIICFLLDNESLSLSLSMMMPMVTIFTVSSCFISGRNEMWIDSYVSQCANKNILDFITDYNKKNKNIFRIININTGEFRIHSSLFRPLNGKSRFFNSYSVFEVNEIKISDDLDNVIKLEKIYNSNPNINIYCSSCEEICYEVKNDDEPKWKIINQNKIIKIVLNYRYMLKNNAMEGSTKLIGKLNISNNQFDILYEKFI